NASYMVEFIPSEARDLLRNEVNASYMVEFIPSECNEARDLARPIGLAVKGYVKRLLRRPAGLARRSRHTSNITFSAPSCNDGIGSRS
ncbi:MAG: hypothetical protein KKG84_05990, partial [Candidatus Omnitrophica bacterium]|nr:hypothetical protein [Candidatus Omnitrophota bacterium]